MGARILIIEDNPANLDLMRYLLASFGHEPLNASSGEEGIELASGERLDLVICDVQLPQMDGFEVARNLKRQPATRHTPLLAVTAYAMVGDREKFLAAGFDGYLSKPIDPQTFVTEVESFLPQALKSANKEQSAPTANVEAEVTAIAANKRARILAVDDLNTNLDLLRSLLQPHGFELIATTSLAEAIELARRVSPDLILSDVNMPPASGRDLMEAIRADPATQGIPVVFLTSTAWRRNTHQELVELGAKAILERPIDPGALLEFIESLLKAQGK